MASLVKYIYQSIFGSKSENIPRDFCSYRSYDPSLKELETDKTYGIEGDNYIKALESLNNDFKKTRKDMVATIMKSKNIMDILNLSTKEWFTKYSQDIIRTFLFCELSKCEITKYGIYKCGSFIVDILKNFELLKTAEESVFGTIGVFKTKYTNQLGNDGYIILKYTSLMDQIQEKHLTHELLVGLVLNQLRETIPNFMYTYGGLYCNAPINDNGTYNLKQICKEDGKYKSTMCFFEKISNSETFQRYTIKWFKTSHDHDFPRTYQEHIEEFENILIQLISSLYMAQTKLGFIHADLHTENILIRDCRKNPIQIGYEGIKTKLICPYVVQIIDYGFATIQYGKSIFKSPTYTYFNKKYNEVYKSNDMHGTFMTLTFLLKEFQYDMSDFWKQFKIIGNFMLEYHKEFIKNTGVQVTNDSVVKQLYLQLISKYN